MRAGGASRQLAFGAIDIEADRLLPACSRLLAIGKGRVAATNEGGR